jgi:hypothetical protein
MKGVPLSPESYEATAAALHQLVWFLTKHHTALNHLPYWVWEKDQSGLDIPAYEAVLARATAELGEWHETRRLLEERPAPVTLEEDGILIACALRFDGYKYREMAGFDEERPLQRFFETGRWDLSPLEQMTTFFILQRGLYKWGLEHEPRDGRYWKAFRSLFLLSYGHRIPHAFRPTDPDLYARWKYRFVPRLAECVSVVRRIHESTTYRGRDRSDECSRPE